MPGDPTIAKPLSEWHEDIGEALWWTYPMTGPPYVGSPLWNDWPGYHTHWTPIVIPEWFQGEERV